MYANDSSLQELMAKRASKSIDPLDGNFDAALQAFTAEAAIYGERISGNTGGITTVVSCGNGRDAGESSC